MSIGNSSPDASSPGDQLERKNVQILFIFKDDTAKTFVVPLSPDRNSNHVMNILRKVTPDLIPEQMISVNDNILDPKNLDEGSAESRLLKPGDQVTVLYGELGFEDEPHFLIEPQSKESE